MILCGEATAPPLIFSLISLKSAFSERNGKNHPRKENIIRVRSDSGIFNITLLRETHTLTL